MKNLIVLSGNVGAGLTTYGEMLSNKLDYDWLPEEPFISTYEKIHKSTERDYCLLSLIENVVNKTVYINDQFLKGKETLIIERFILDELVRFHALMDLYTIEQHISIYDNLINLLNNICCDIKIEYFLIKIDTKNLKIRNGNRQNRFKYTVHDSIIESIDLLYEDRSLYKDAIIHKINSANKSNEEVIVELSKHIEIFISNLV
ncbi:MAG: deoxynucleoside kinase [Bacteroidales bacterium]|jgi:deoxyadenosine/deoxycytidine kinase|nr:deoxynucleoside kinase [Bacteroidales bacterium]